MQEKLNALSLGEKLVVVGGVVLLIASFLPWYKVDFGGLAGLGLDIGSVTRNGWQSPGALFSLLAVLVGVVMAGSILAVKFGNMKLPDMGNFTLGQAYLAGGGAVAVLILIKLANESSHMSYGFYLGIIAAAALAVGGWLLYSEEKSGTSSSIGGQGRL